MAEQAHRGGGGPARAALPREGRPHRGGDGGAAGRDGDEEAQGERPREAALREQDPVRPGAAGCTPQEGAGERAAEAACGGGGGGGGGEWCKDVELHIKNTLN